LWSNIIVFNMSGKKIKKNVEWRRCVKRKARKKRKTLNQVCFCRKFLPWSSIRVFCKNFNCILFRHIRWIVWFVSNFNVLLVEPMDNSDVQTPENNTFSEREREREKVWVFLFFMLVSQIRSIRGVRYWCNMVILSGWNRKRKKNVCIKNVCFPILTRKCQLEFQFFFPTPGVILVKKWEFRRRIRLQRQREIETRGQVFFCKCFGFKFQFLVPLFSSLSFGFCFWFLLPGF